MSKRTTMAKIARLYRTVELLSARQRGLMPKELSEQSGVHVSTVYRDLQTLEEAGVPLRQTAGRYLLMQKRDLPALQPTGLQHAALILARQALSPLEGSRLCDALEQLIQGPAKPSQGPTLARRRPPKASSPSALQDSHATLIKEIERALHRGCRFGCFTVRRRRSKAVGAR